MSRSALFATMLAATMLLPSLAAASCGSKTSASSCAEGMSWSTTQGKCVPTVGS